MSSNRLDLSLVENNYYPTRSKATKAIEEGLVLINNKIIYEKNYQVKANDIIKVLAKTNTYVSRGGYKLEKALQVFKVNCQDLIAIDVGASTGGFSDCLIQNGIKKVYAIDVGVNQLDSTIKDNPKIIALEKLNFRNLNDEIKDEFQLVTVDVSFISLYYIFERLARFTHQFDCICLIKPQFEAGKDKVGKNGIVKEEKTHIEVLQKVENMASLFNFQLINLDFSPIRGEKQGNIEFLGFFSNYQKRQDKIDITQIVKSAHKELK